MVIERAMNDQFLSNTYLVGEEGGEGFFVDAGGPVAPLIEAAERLDITPTHVLLTHHHYDHVSELPLLLERWPDLQVLAHPLERPLVEELLSAQGGVITGTLAPDEEIVVGGLTVRPLHTPGHTAGMLSLLIDDPTQPHVFTGDTLFKNSVGGVRAPGSTSYADLKSSVMETLLGLPGDTVIHPGHTDPTTVADEWDNNAFVRVWRGLDDEGAEEVRALGEPATLVLLGDDYDGGYKAWVRWPDGRDDIVPGSKIERGDGG